VGWLARLLGSEGSAGQPTFDSLAPGDEIWSGGQPWQVTAVLIYKNADGEWPVVHVRQALTQAWVSVEDDQPVRYDHLDLHVQADGKAVWNGRTYSRQEVGTATISRVLGDVDARPGDTLSYEVLRCPDDSHAWISVEMWAGGYVEVSVGRPWAVEKLVTKREGRA
jgi:uncharacterized protein DUF4178